MIYRLMVLIAAVVLSSAFFTTQAQQRSAGKGVQKAVPRCKPNPDSLYDRSRVLEELAEILNKSIPEWSKGLDRGFYSDDERAIAFFVVDLTNPSNREIHWDDCVDFINGHVYHVAPPDLAYSLSHIVFLEDGKLKVFRSVNCPSRGDRLEDAINYISAKLSHDPRRDEIIARVRQYRKYGEYGRLHHPQINCKD